MISSPGVSRPRVSHKIRHRPSGKSSTNNPSHFPPVASRIPKSRAGRTRVLLKTIKSDGRRKPGRSAIDEWVIERALQSNTIRRAPSRRSDGREAISSDGNSYFHASSSSRSGVVRLDGSDTLPLSRYPEQTSQCFSRDRRTRTPERPSSWCWFPTIPIPRRTRR